MNFIPRTALGHGLLDLSAFTRDMQRREIRGLLQRLDMMAANNFDLKEGVRGKLLARLRDLEAT